MVREMVATLSSQVSWRFAALFEFPFRFPQLLRPGITVQEQLDLLADFFERDDCCHDELFGLRVRKTHRSPQHLLDDKPFVDMLKAWCLSFCFTNMWCERLLAAIRQRTRHSDMHIERVVSVGMLLQLLNEHNRVGRQNPLVVKKEQLLEAGVPLKCRPKARIWAPQPGGLFVCFLNRKETERKDAGIVMKRDEWLAFRKKAVVDFGKLDEAELHQEAVALARAHEEKLDLSSDESTEPMDEDTGTMLDHVGDRFTPFFAFCFLAHRRSPRQCNSLLV